MLFSILFRQSSRVISVGRYSTRINLDVLPPKNDGLLSDGWVDPKQYLGDALSRSLERLSDEDFASFLLSSTTSTLFSRHFTAAHPEMRSNFLSTYAQHLETRARRFSRTQLFAAATGLQFFDASDLTPYIIRDRLEKDPFPDLAEGGAIDPLELLGKEEFKSLLSSTNSSNFDLPTDVATAALPSNFSQLITSQFAKDIHADVEETDDLLRFNQAVQNQDIQSIMDSLQIGDHPDIKSPLLDSPRDFVDALLNDPAGKSLQNFMDAPLLSEEQRNEYLAKAYAMTAPADRPTRQLYENLANNTANIIDIANYLADQPHPDASAPAEFLKHGQSLYQLLNNPHVNKLHRPHPNADLVRSEFSVGQCLAELHNLATLTAMDAKELAGHLLSFPPEEPPSETYLATYATLAAERLAEFDNEDVSMLLAGFEQVNYQPPGWITDRMAEKVTNQLITAQLRTLKE